MKEVHGIEELKYTARLDYLENRPGYVAVRGTECVIDHVVITVEYRPHDTDERYDQFIYRVNHALRDEDFVIRLLERLGR